MAIGKQYSKKINWIKLIMNYLSDNVQMHKALEKKTHQYTNIKMHLQFILRCTEQQKLGKL